MLWGWYMRCFDGGIWKVWVWHMRCCECGVWRVVRVVCERLWVWYGRGYEGGEWEVVRVACERLCECGVSEFGRVVYERVYDGRVVRVVCERLWRWFMLVFEESVGEVVWGWCVWGYVCGVLEFVKIVWERLRVWCMRVCVRVFVRDCESGVWETKRLMFEKLWKWYMRDCEGNIFEVVRVVCKMWVWCVKGCEGCVKSWPFLKSNCNGLKCGSMIYISLCSNIFASIFHVWLNNEMPLYDSHSLLFSLFLRHVFFGFLPLLVSC
jgi:hypothetical protein